MRTVIDKKVVYVKGVTFATTRSSIRKPHTSF